MRIWICALLLFSASFSEISSAQSAASNFVRERVELIGCAFQSNLITQALEIGLSRISAVNFTLADGIARGAFLKPLKIYCDIGPAPAAINYNPDDDSIHLRINSSSNSNTMANFFHEFLHFYGLDHVDDSRIVGDFDVFVYDSVYACHLTGFPELAERLKISPSIVKAAANMCASAKPVAQDMREFKYKIGP